MLHTGQVWTRAAADPGRLTGSGDLHLAAALDPAWNRFAEILGLHLESPRHFVTPGRVMNKME